MTLKSRTPRFRMLTHEARVKEYQPRYMGRALLGLSLIRHCHHMGQK